jgi:hypothetical protein
MGVEPDRHALWLTTRASGDTWDIREGELTVAALLGVRNLYCATKPMVAMGVLALLERRGVDWTKARVDAHGQLRSDGPWAITDLLAGRTALVRPTIWEVLRLPLGQAEPELAASAERVEATPGGAVGRSEVLAWYVLARTAAGSAGEAWAAELQQDLRAALGTRLWLVPDRELLGLPVSAMVTLTLAHGDGEVPLLDALTVRSRALTSPYLGGYGSFASVVEWFQRLGRHLLGGEGRTRLFPDAARIRSAWAPALDGDGGSGLGLEIVVGQDGEARLGLQAAGGALSVELDPDRGTVTAVLGSRFLDDPRRRRDWLAREWGAAHAWLDQVGGRT